MSCSRRSWSLDEGPYLALILSEADNPLSFNASLRMLLILACSMSEFIRIIFPLASLSLPLIDSSFDQLVRMYALQNCSLHKDFVTRSKGIQYVEELLADERRRFLECATFTLTTNRQVRNICMENGLPHAFVFFFPHDTKTEMDVRYFGKVADESLELNLRRCARLNLNDRCFSSILKSRRLHSAKMI
jgi:hypothetical protein